MPVDEIRERGVRSVHNARRAAMAGAKRILGIGRARGRDEPPEYVLVEDPPDEFKKCYLGVLVWLVHRDDDLIDERELCEIQLQMTRLNCSAEVRRAVRSYLEDPRRLNVEAQIGRMLERVPPPKSDNTMALKCSLMKDAIRVRRATSEEFTWDRGIVRLAELLDLSGEQVEFLNRTCVEEERILAGELSDSQITNAAKEMAAKATGLGVPLVAIYASGSVAGFSAAGITSGLAALGLGGVLGLSAMVTGIGVVIVVGGVAYKGVRWVLDGSERDRASLRELMLQEVLLLHQGAIINLGEDMSFLGERVEALSRKTDRNREAIDWLTREVILLSRAASAMRRLGERAYGFRRDLEEKPERDARSRAGAR